MTRASNCLLGPALTLLIVSLTLPSLSAQEPGSVVAADARVQGLTYTMEATGEDVPYALFVPSDYDASREWPLIVALHGLGRPFDWVMGYDGYIDMAERDGYITVAPKGYHPRAWYGSRGPGIPRGAAREGEEGNLADNLGELGEQDVMNVLAIIRDSYNIDDERIYLWGHSMGGAGTYHLAAKHPDIWAALGVAAPAPSAPPEQLEAFKHIPIIALQGDEDGLVVRTREWVTKMSDLGMQHVYIEIEGGDHSRFINSSAEMISKLFSFFDIVRKDQLGR
jgi:predicted peptidase